MKMFQRFFGQTSRKYQKEKNCNHSSYSSMAGFIVQDSLKVLTQNGECQIDLCLGDITMLGREDKVDVIMVSAFRDDYVPTRTSVIGALQYNLGLSVGELSRNKAEDLRNLYSCWWSHPLPDEMPYNRLLCFETNIGGLGRPQELVANVYRCLVPILNNEDGTVITPLLNTGVQGYGEIGMLQGMVVAAVNWMKAGLPLRLLKIVIYAKVVDGMLKKASLMMRRFRNICQKFTDLKERYDSQYLVPKAVPIEFDIYLSYSEDDKGIVNSIQEGLKAAKSDIRIFGNKQEIDTEAVWQQDMYQVMMRSAKVVTGKAWQRTLYHSIDGSRCLLALISENYIKSPVCQEEYNLALAKHSSGDGSMQLILLCLEELKEVPATFSKVNMVKATPDVFDSVTMTVCKAVVNWLTGKDVDPNVEHILKTDKKFSWNMDKVSEDQRRATFTAKYGTEDKKLLSMEKQFPAKLQSLIESRPSSALSRSGDAQEEVDIVFNCAQEDWKYASFLKAVFKDAAPSLVVKATIKSEKERLTLMDTARCVVAFLTPDYLDSPEQVEEFHIALCRQRLSPTTILFPITIHALPQKPTYFHLVPSPVNVTDAMWAELAHKWNVHVPKLGLHREEAPRLTVSAEVALGLHEAACILINSLKAGNERDKVAGGGNFSQPVLHNVLTIQDTVTEGSRGQAVELDKMLITLNITSSDATADMLKQVSTDCQESAKDLSSPNTKELTLRPEESTHEQTTEPRTVVSPGDRETSIQDSDNKVQNGPCETQADRREPTGRPKSSMCALV